MQVIRRRVWRMVWIPVFFGTGAGCGGGEAGLPDRMNFAVVDSLLGPDVGVTRAGLQLNPPRSFFPVPDSMFSLFQARLQVDAGPDAGVEMVGCFLDSARPVGLIVSVIDSLNLAADTGGYFNRYGNSLRETFAEAEVREGEYRVGNVFVKNYLVIDSVYVRFQLLCLSASNPAMGLLYFAPRAVYPEYVRRFESSIGSMRPITQGGS